MHHTALLAIVVAICLTSCSTLDTRLQGTYTPPDDIPGRSCTLQCKQIQNQCLDQQREIAKGFVVGRDPSGWQLYYNRWPCDKEYHGCFVGCGGTVTQPPKEALKRPPKPGVSILGIVFQGLVSALLFL
jgi:hypothetical protein